MLDTPVPLNHPAMFTSQATLGSMLLTFNANELTAKCMTSNGTIGDYFTIQKDPSLPGDPSSIDVDVGTTCGLRILWGTDTGATSYEVYRSENPYPRREPIASGIRTTSYTDPAPTRGNTYHYSVRGTKSGGDGPWTDSDSGVMSSGTGDSYSGCGCGSKSIGTFPYGRENCSDTLTSRRPPLFRYILHGTLAN